MFSTMVLRYIRAVLISKAQRKAVASLMYHQVSLNREMKDRYVHDHDRALVERGLREAWNPFPVLIVQVSVFKIQVHFT